MRLAHKVVVGIGVAAVVAVGVHSLPHKTGPSALYPNPQYTPGLADTLDVQTLTQSFNGQTYSQAHRNVTEATKTAVKREYAQTEASCTSSTCEIDHFYPMCAGGSNDITNLWLQPAQNKWNGKNYGFHEKDKLETYVCSQIKAGKLSPKDAYACVVNDWVSCYNKYVANTPSFGAIEDTDGDDY